MRPLPPRMQESLFHDMILPEETRQIRAKAREFAVRVVAPRAGEIAHTEERVESVPRDVFKALAVEDFFKVPFSEKDGGLGLKHPSSATVGTVEELAYMRNSVAAIYDAHCILAGHALEYGSDLIREKYLRPMTTGQKIGCFATTEPTASTDLSLRSLQTKGVKRGCKIMVSGQKRFITNACVADFVTALVNVEGQMCMQVIDLNWPGCRVGQPDKKLGNNGQLTSGIYFDNVEVPQENLIGQEGRGLYVALGTLTYGRVGIAASGVGMAQSVFDECVSYMKQREAFGKKLSQFQYWQFHLAERAIQIENARNLYSKAALRLDQGVEFPEPEAAGAKFYGTQCVGGIARDGVQIFGGYGFMRSLGHDGSTYKVEEVYRDFKIAEIYEGTNEIQKMIITRTIFGRDAV